MIDHAMVVLYVASQERSRDFYSAVLATKPTLDVPGITEYKLSQGSSLALMPEKGISRLLGEKLPDPAQANGIPRVEVYLLVEDPVSYHARALEAGAKELSPLTKRDWGDLAAYSMDPDGHVLAFATSSSD